MIGNDTAYGLSEGGVLVSHRLCKAYNFNFQIHIVLFRSLSLSLSLSLTYSLTLTATSISQQKCNFPLEKA